ncbi:hypothetical protein NPIL_229011 [Nephila pilipes]|uniref:Uncharacterized protein n=1 Tax=Nephila pilipes TaxID=299642 RepID=A0A8X6P1W0_NEPPI|nr:hypothetical protein NPIL_229011 [Nephila pilipes]
MMCVFFVDSSLCFGCVVVTLRFVTRNDAFHKWVLFVKEELILQAGAHSLRHVIRNKVFRYPLRTDFTLLQILMDDQLHCSFTQTQCYTDVMSHNPLIRGLGRFDIDVCLSRKILHHLFNTVRPKQFSP